MLGGAENSLDVRLVLAVAVDVVGMTAWVSGIKCVASPVVALAMTDMLACVVVVYYRFLSGLMSETGEEEMKV